MVNKYTVTDFGSRVYFIPVRHLLSWLITRAGTFNASFEYHIRWLRRCNVRAWNLGSRRISIDPLAARSRSRISASSAYLLEHASDRSDLLPSASSPVMVLSVRFQLVCRPISFLRRSIVSMLR